MTVADRGSAWRRIATIAGTDVRMRLARGSTVVVLVALCIFAYVLVPDLSTGRALMQVNGHRALYNSVTIALATSSLCAVMLGLAGFYLTSNTVRRDAESRTGYVIASTRVRSLEYLIGKMLGSAAFLGLIVLVYVLNVMGMQLLRGEAPVEPLVYLAMFLAIETPVIVVVSAIALMFECVRPLSGRFGDILYFFTWATLLSVPAATSVRSGAGSSHFDVFGMAFVINAANDQVESDFHAHPEVSIGSSHFDPKQSPWRFKGVTWTAAVIESRLTSALIALPALLIAWLSFARFDPARTRSGAAGARTSVRGRVSAPLRGMIRVLRPASWSGHGLVRATLGEIALTIMLRPILVLGVLAAAITGAVLPTTALRTALIPIIFVALIATLAEIPTRDRSARVDGIRNGIVGVRASSIYAKLLAAFAIAVAFLLVPLLRMSVTSPGDALSLLIGGWLFAAAGVGLGTLAHTPKLFAGSALLFLYVVVSSAHAPEFDFAGWNGAAGSEVRAAYFLTAALFAALAIFGDWRAMRAER